MKIEKGLFIKEIRDGGNIEGLFLVKDVRRAETRTGSPYLMLNVMDRTGEMAGRVWNDADRWITECRPGGVVLLKGRAQAYKGVLQLKINTLKAADSSNLDMTDFVPTAPGDIKSMAAEVIKLAKTVKNPHLQQLLLLFFKDTGFFENFKKAPAAKSMHHAYMGGLLEHTLAVTRLADKVSILYPEIDRSILITGSLLHDIGKIQEFGFDSFPFDYTVKGRLVGHLVIGVDMVQEKIRELPDFPEELGVRLKHLILSHHGRHEFGSPTLPMMREAFILHFLDDLDAKINYINRLEDQAQDSGYQWTEYQRNLERFLFVNGRASSEEPPKIQDRKSPDITDKTTGPKQMSFLE